jgi:hypothetical protein
LVTPVAAQPARRSAPAPVMDSMALRAHTYFLAHDLLEKRNRPTRE